jgi:hypothetical protein
MNRVARLAVGIALAAVAVAGCTDSSGTSAADRSAAEAAAAPMAAASRKAAAAQPAPAPAAAPVQAQQVAAAPLAPEDRTVGEGLTALAPIRDGALVVVPIAAAAPKTSPNYLTLDEGMRRGVVSVREMSDIDYNRLMVANSSDQTLCVLAGELILDGHQDRTFAESLAFAPRERTDVPVMCVEPDRDSGPSRAFRSGKAMVHSELRRQLYQGTQSTVWEEVRRYNRAHDIYNSTSTYRTAASHQRDGVQGEWRTRVIAQLAELPERDRLVGMAIALEGRLISVDVFTTPKLYRDLEPKLLGSVVAQAIDSHREIRNPRPAEIRDLLSSATANECGRTGMSAPAARSNADAWQ